MDENQEPAWALEGLQRPISRLVANVTSFPLELRHVCVQSFLTTVGQNMTPPSDLGTDFSALAGTIGLVLSGTYVGSRLLSVEGGALAGRAAVQAAPTSTAAASAAVNLGQQWSGMARLR